MKNYRLLLVTLSILMLAACASQLLTPPCLAGAVTDGSAGSVQTLSGNFTVPQSLGTVRGTNLFHSFTRFGVAATR